MNSGRFASHNNEKGVGLFLHQHKGSIRRRARLHEEAPGSRQSSRRGLAVNSWVGGKGRPPREMETAPREWSRLPLTAESRPSVRAPPMAILAAIVIVALVLGLAYVLRH